MMLDAKGQAVRGVLADKIEATIIKRRIDLIALDPYVKTHALGENSNNDMDELAQLLTDLGEKYDIAVDVLHHTRKGSSDPGNADSGRGAGATKDAGRLVYTATRMSPAEAEAFGIPEDRRRFFVRMDEAKVNIVPATKAKWFQLVSVPLGNATELYPHGDDVQTVEPWTPPEAWQDISVELQNRILDTIDAGLPDGNRFTVAPRVMERAARKVILEHAPEKTEAQAREIIKTWVKNGVLLSAEYDNPKTRKKVSGLRVNPEKRPT
jgi:AAA domain